MSETKTQWKQTQSAKLPTGILAMSDLAADQMVVGCMDGVYAVSLDTLEAKKLDSHGNYVSGVAIANDHVISAGYDGHLQWFDLNAQERVRRTKLHDFWSWDSAISPDKRWVASVTGQYLAGGYKYEPAAEREPSVKVVDAQTGDTKLELSHVPSVQAVAFSRDNRFVAAGNLMGEVRVWDIETGKRVANWTTPDFTSWGIIKSHCFLGGIFALEFTADSNELLVAGMGEMRDPMAGNGRQLWQRWSWKSGKPEKLDETHKGESGEGLMEALAVAPDGSQFAMGGRLRGGQWNVALFDMATGAISASLKTGYRVTDMRFSNDAKQLYIVGTNGQPSKFTDGKNPDFGRLEVYAIS